MEFQVGDWTAVRSTNELVRGATRVRLEARAMEVLQLLHQSGGEVVSKGDLIDAVWKLHVVSDHSITVVISDLRRALGDDPRNPRYIETIPKRGYRLVRAAVASPDLNPVTATVGTAKPFNSMVKWIALGLGVLMVGWWIAATTEDTPPALPERLVVLDAVNSTNDPSVDALASSITELTLDGISRSKSVELVRWRREVSAAEAEQQGRGDLLLETKIIDAEDIRLLAMTLKHVGTGEIRWTTTQTVSPRHFRMAQDKALRELSVELGVDDIPGHQPVFSALSEELFWRARYLWSLRQRTAALRARSLFLEVLEMEPEYYRAHAALADLYSHKTGSFFIGVVENPIELAQFHVARAAEIDPDAIEVALSRGHIALFVDSNPEKALTYLVDVVDRAPNSAVAWVSYANALAASGQFSAAVDAINLAQRADPMEPSLLLDKVWILLLARQLDQALVAAEAAEKLGLPVSLYRGLVFGAAGDHKQAIEGWTEFLGPATPQSVIDQISQASSSAQYLLAYQLIGNAIIEHRGAVSPVIPAVAFGLAEDYTRTRDLLNGLTGSDENWLKLWARHLPIVSRAYKNGEIQTEQ